MRRENHLSPKQAHETRLTGMSRREILRAIARGELRALKYRSGYLIPESSIDEFLERLEGNPPEQRIVVRGASRGFEAPRLVKGGSR